MTKQMLLGEGESVKSPRFLIEHSRCFYSNMNCCPRAKTMEGWSDVLQANVVIAIGCHGWTCPVCGRKKVSHYAQRVASARPNRLITLTVNNKLHIGPREAYDTTRRKIGSLTSVLRRAYGEFEFFRVLEITKKGWPHYHLITRCPYIPQAEISMLWNRLTGAPIVDVRALDKHVKTYFYVVKYLGKQRYISWTDRRAAWTRNFFPKEEFKAGPGLEILQPYFHNEHPSLFVRWNYPGQWLEPYSATCWIRKGTET